MSAAVDRPDDTLPRIKNSYEHRLPYEQGKEWWMIKLRGDNEDDELTFVKWSDNEGAKVKQTDLHEWSE